MNMRIKHGPHLCPICGKCKFLSWGSYDVCDYCGWEDDTVQTDDPDYEAGANEWSLNVDRFIILANCLFGWVFLIVY